MYTVSWKKQLILALILVVGGYFAYWHEFKRRPETEDADAQAKKLFALQGKQIESVKLSNGTQSWEFKCLDLAVHQCKTDGVARWELEQPEKVAADSTSVASLLSQLNNTTSNQTIDLKTETPEKRQSLLKDYGLSADLRAKAKTIEIHLDGGQTLQAYLGVQNPIDSSYFTVTGSNGTVREDRVLLIPSYFASSFDQKTTYWRDKKIATVENSKVTDLKITGTKGSVEAIKKDGVWTLAGKSGESIPGDTENIDGLISSAGYLTAKDFPETTILKGLSPKVELTLTSDGKPLTFKFYEKTEKAPAGRSKNPMEPKPGTTKRDFVTTSASNIVSEVDGTTVARFDKSSKDLRLNRFLSAIERFSIRKIDFIPSSKNLAPTSLRFENSTWVIHPDGGNTTPADSDKVQTFLDRISGNRIQDFAEGSSAPKPTKDALKVLLSDEKGTKKHEILFWLGTGGKLYAKDLLSKRDEVLTVDVTLSTALPWRTGYFNKKAGAPVSSAAPAAAVIPAQAPHP